MTHGIKPLRFIFITPCVVEAFFKTVRRGALDAAAALEVTCDFTGTDDVNIPAQAEMVDRAVAEKYDGIALSVCDPTAFNDVVAKAIKAGIPVIAFNIDDRSDGNPRLAGISQDFRAAGRKLATRIADKVDRNRTVLVTKHSEGVSALEERIAGIEDVLNASGIATKTIVSGMFAREATPMIARELADTSIGGIVGTGQADTEGAALAVEQLPVEQRIPVAGFDLSEEILRLIRQGIILGAIDQQPYLQGFYPLVQLTHHARFGFAPVDIDAGAALVDADNVETVMTLCKEGYR